MLRVSPVPGLCEFRAPQPHSTQQLPPVTFARQPLSSSSATPPRFGYSGAERNEGTPCSSRVTDAAAVALREGWATACTWWAWWLQAAPAAALRSIVRVLSICSLANRLGPGPEGSLGQRLTPGTASQLPWVSRTGWLAIDQSGHGPQISMSYHAVRNTDEISAARGKPSCERLRSGLGTAERESRAKRARNGLVGSPRGAGAPAAALRARHPAGMITTVGRGKIALAMPRFGACLGSSYGVLWAFWGVGAPC